jgi:hypothetical protein
MRPSFYFRTASAALAVLGAVAAGRAVAQPLPTGNSLAVTLRPQETDMWCWAASGQMVMEYLGRLVAQCEQANNRFGLTACCQSPVPGDCAQGGWPEFGKYGFTYHTTSDTPLSWDQIKEQISVRHTPFAFSWHWTGGGGHMMVVTGYSEHDGDRWVRVLDPWPPNSGDTREVTYSFFVAGPDHTHWDDYFDLAPAASGGHGPEPPSAGPGAAPAGPPPDAAAALKAAAPTAQAALERYRRQAPAPPGTAESRQPEGIPVYTVPLDKLKEAPAQQAPGGSTGLFTQSGVRKIIYPITAGEAPGGAASAITLQPAQGRWEVASIGGGALAGLLNKARAEHAAATRASPSAYFAVRVPAMNLYFVAYNADDGLRLIPILDEPRLGLKAGQPVKAVDLLPKLVAEAKRHNGLPR